MRSSTRLPGREAIQRASVSIPSLIIADWRLPDLPNGELVRRVLTDNRLNGVPLVVCTADVRATIDQSHAGVRTWLLKPCEPTSILALVQKLAPLAEPAPPQSG